MQYVTFLSLIVTFSVHVHNVQAVPHYSDLISENVHEASVHHHVTKRMVQNKEEDEEVFEDLEGSDSYRYPVTIFFL